MHQASAILLCGAITAGIVPLVRRIAGLVFQQLVLAEPSQMVPFLAAASAASRPESLLDRECEADALMITHP